MKLIPLSLLVLVVAPSAVVGEIPPASGCDVAAVEALECPDVDLTTCDLPIGIDNFSPELTGSECVVNDLEISCSGCSEDSEVENRSEDGCVITGPNLNDVTEDVTFVRIDFILGGLPANPLTCIYCVEVVPERVCRLRNGYWPTHRGWKKPLLRTIKKKIKKTKQGGVCPGITNPSESEIIDFCAGPEPSFPIERIPKKIKKKGGN